MKTLFHCFVACFVIIAGCSSPADRPPSSGSVSALELKEHVRFLASPKLEGRKTGEAGNVLAAQYIADHFKEYGLSPLGDNRGYFQNFSFVASIKAGKKNSLTVTAGGKRLAFDQEASIRPLSFSVDTSITAPLVFAGYGITDTSLRYDDYGGLDVKNKIVVILRYTPEGKSPEKGFAKHAALRVKAFNARIHEAAGMILVAGPVDEEEPRLSPLSYDRGMGTSGIAAISMKWDALDTLFHRLGKDLRSVQQEINAGKAPRSFPMDDAGATLETQIVKIQKESANILGYLEGSDSLLKGETVVLGAHMDHLGWGGENSGSLKPDTNAIHPGADDNASGTAGLLEAAQYLAARRHSLKRSILFTSFSGEELGLLGSDYYVKHPVIPLERTIAMLNMDMIGRLKDSILVVEGIGTSPGFEEMVKRNQTDPSIKLKLKPDGFGPSDHASFYGKDLPVLFFFTNVHSDYHKPSDTWEKINFAGEQEVVELVDRIATDLANAPGRPGFTKVLQVAGSRDERRDVRVRLGVVPDYADDVVGLKISGTSAGTPAEKAGLKANDIIVKFQGKEIKNIYDYMHMLEECKPGDVVSLVVKRGTEEVTLSAKLDARP